MLQKFAKNATVRGSRFTQKEYEGIAKSWIANLRNKQKGYNFFTKLQTIHNETFRIADRDLRSIESIEVRCKAIQKKTMLFNRCHARNLRSNPTGVSGPAMISMATCVYNWLDMDNVDDDFGKPLKFMDACNILRIHQKLLEARHACRNYEPEKKSVANITESAN